MSHSISDFSQINPESLMVIQARIEAEKPLRSVFVADESVASLRPRANDMLPAGEAHVLSTNSIYNRDVAIVKSAVSKTFAREVRESGRSKWYRYGANAMRVITFLVPFLNSYVAKRLDESEAKDQNLEETRKKLESVREKRNDLVRKKLKYYAELNILSEYLTHPEWQSPSYKKIISNIIKYNDEKIHEIDQELKKTDKHVMDTLRGLDLKDAKDSMESGMSFTEIAGLIPFTGGAAAQYAYASERLHDFKESLKAIEEYDYKKFLLEGQVAVINMNLAGNLNHIRSIEEGRIYGSVAEDIKKLCVATELKLTVELNKVKGEIKSIEEKQKALVLKLGLNRGDALIAETEKYASLGYGAYFLFRDASLGLLVGEAIRNASSIRDLPHAFANVTGVAGDVAGYFGGAVIVTAPFNYYILNEAKKQLKTRSTIDEVAGRFVQGQDSLSEEKRDPILKGIAEIIKKNQNTKSGWIDLNLKRFAFAGSLFSSIQFTATALASVKGLAIMGSIATGLTPVGWGFLVGGIVGAVGFALYGLYKSRQRSKRESACIEVLHKNTSEVGVINFGSDKVQKAIYELSTINEGFAADMLLQKLKAEDGEGPVFNFIKDFGILSEKEVRYLKEVDITTSEAEAKAINFLKDTLLKQK